MVLRLKIVVRSCKRTYLLCSSFIIYVQRSSPLTHCFVNYRDLKPSNVGFNEAGEVKLYDFGLARELLDDGRKMTGYTGSARYMAPEGMLDFVIPTYFIYNFCSYVQSAIY